MQDYRGVVGDGDGNEQPGAGDAVLIARIARRRKARSSRWRTVACRFRLGHDAGCRCGIPIIAGPRIRRGGSVRVSCSLKPPWHRPLNSSSQLSSKRMQATPQREKQ